MTNYEKYKDLVISCIARDSICNLANVAYEHNSCDGRTCVECGVFVAQWLNRKYNEIDWTKVPVDTPVIIKKDEKGIMFRREKGIMFRHFAKYYRGHVFVYANGQTSWTNNGETQAWEPEYVKFGRDEDSKKYAKQ